MSLADSNLLYREPQLYDDMFVGDSGRAELVLQLIRTYGPVNAATLLDLGCGTGRDLADLANTAPQLATVGIDLQLAMIDYGRRTRPHLDLRVDDIRTVRLGSTFDVITCLGNTLAYLHTEAELDAAFATFAVHAHAGTLLVLQTLIGTPNTGPPRTTTIEALGCTAEVTTHTTYDPHTRIAATHRVWVFSGGRKATDHIRRRVLTCEELHVRLRCAGFRLHVVSDNPMNQESTAIAPTAYAVATASRGSVTSHLSGDEP
jgi:SAM-dependent methyltransferase